MRKILIIATSVFALSSCLKKIEQVDTANTNIYDINYQGEQWFVLEDIYLYTQNNNQFVSIDYRIPRSFAPDLSPTGIMVEGLVNDYDAKLDSAIIGSDGSYYGSFSYLYDGSTNYCLNAGVYIRELDYSINHFADCTEL